MNSMMGGFVPTFSRSLCYHKLLHIAAANNLGDKDQTDQEREGTDTKITTTLKGSMGERINKALAKVEEKKRKRAARRALVKCRTNDKLS